MNKYNTHNSVQLLFTCKVTQATVACLLWLFKTDCLWPSVLRDHKATCSLYTLHWCPGTQHCLLSHKHFHFCYCQSLRLSCYCWSWHRPSLECLQFGFTTHLSCYASFIPSFISCWVASPCVPSHFTVSCPCLQSPVVAYYLLASSFSWVVILTGLVTIPFTSVVMLILFRALPVQEPEMLCLLALVLSVSSCYALLPCTS